MKCCKSKSTLILGTGDEGVPRVNAPSAKNIAAWAATDQNSGVLKRLSEDIVEWLELV